MTEDIIKEIESKLRDVLNAFQQQQLHDVLVQYTNSEEQDQALSILDENKQILELFLKSKRLEGCSERTISYYGSTIERMLNTVEYSYKDITTEVLREYLMQIQNKGTCSRVTLDNIRRNLSSFFSWLEDENYIVKNPVRRIHRVKTEKLVREVYSDEMIEAMRDHCKNIRDLAIIDLLSSTGMRVGELVKLNRCDVRFMDRECIVFGKGAKQRRVYFDARTKLHLQQYLEQRVDSNKALFVTLLKPYNRLQISGVEIRLRKLGKRLNIPNVYPHKFRRTLATNAIDKGMPIEQVQKLLGHETIDTTLQYALVKQSNVKLSHKKYIG